MPTKPIKTCLTRLLSESTTEESSCDEARHPSSKRQRSDQASMDLLAAQQAYAAVMGLKKQALAPLSGALPAQPGSAATAAAAAAPAAAPGASAPRQQPEVALVGGGRQHSMNELLEAAEILTALTAKSLYRTTTQSPLSHTLSVEAYSDPWDSCMAHEDKQEGADMGADDDQEWTLPRGSRAALKPRKKAATGAGAAKRGPAKGCKVADKRNPHHVSADAPCLLSAADVSCCPRWTVNTRETTAGCLPD